MSETYPWRETTAPGRRTDRQVWPPPGQALSPEVTQPHAYSLSEVIPAAPLGPPAAPQQRTRKRRRGLRLLVQALVALVLVGITVGARMWDEDRLYRDYRAPERVQRVPAGATGTLKNTTFTVSVRLSPDPPDTSSGPERDFLRITVEATPHDAQAAKELKPAFEMRDAADRRWLAIAAVTPEKVEAGQVARYEVVAIVPSAVASKVELMLRPAEHQRDGRYLQFAR